MPRRAGEQGLLMKHEELGPYLVSAPLYQPAEIEDANFKTYPQSANPTYRALILPPVVKRHCDTCDGRLRSGR